MQALKVLLEGLETQERTAGVTTILVNGLGKPWQPNQLIREITLVSDAHRHFHFDEDTGLPRKKHLHDLRGTLILRTLSPKRRSPTRRSHG